MYFFFQNPFTSQARQNNNYENAVTYKMLLAWNALIYFSRIYSTTAWHTQVKSYQVFMEIITWYPFQFSLFTLKNLSAESLIPTPQNANAYLFSAFIWRQGGRVGVLKKVLTFKFCIIMALNSNDFSRYCSVHQHGCCDVTEKPRIYIYISSAVARGGPSFFPRK